MADERTLEVLLKLRDLASAELKRFSDETKKAGKSVTNEFKQVKNSLVEVRNAIGNLLGIPLTIAGIALAVKGLFTETLAWGQEITTLATTLGITVDQMIKLDAVAVRVGYNTEGLQTAFRNLSQIMENARDGDTKSIILLDMMGIKYEEVTNGTLNLYDAFGRVVNRLSQMEKGSYRNVVAGDLFAKQGQKLLEIADEGKGKFNDFADASAKAVHSLDNLDVEKLNKLKKDFDTTKESALNLGREVVVTNTSLKGYGIVGNIIAAILGRETVLTDAETEALKRRNEEQEKYLISLGEVQLNNPELVAQAKEFIKHQKEIADATKSAKEQTEALGQVFKRDISNATINANGNLRLLLENLKEFRNVMAKQTGGQKYVKELDMLIEKVDAQLLYTSDTAGGFGRAWDVAMNRATDTTINWIDTMNQGVDSFKTMWSDAFYGMMTGTFKTKEVFRKFAQDIFRIISNLMAQQTVASFFSMFGGGATTGSTIQKVGTTTSVGVKAANGGVFPTLTPFSNGGVVDRTTLAMIGEGSNREAVVPLPDNRSIPVKMIGGGGDSKAVNVNFTIVANDAKGFDELLAKRKDIIVSIMSEAMRTNRDYRKSIATT